MLGPEHVGNCDGKDFGVLLVSRDFYFQRLGVQQVQEKVLQIAWLLEPGDH